VPRSRNTRRADTKHPRFPIVSRAQYDRLETRCRLARGEAQTPRTRGAPHADTVFVPILGNLKE